MSRQLAFCERLLCLRGRQGEQGELRLVRRQPCPSRWALAAVGRFGSRASLYVSALAVALFALPAACLHFALTLIAVTWAYSAPPFSLQRRGFGELSITSVFAILVPALAATSHGHQYTLSMAASMAPIGLAMFARMLVMNLSDFDSDIATGKRTLAIRLGRLPSAAMYFGCQILAMATCIALAVVGITPVRPILFAAMTVKSVAQRKLWQFGQNTLPPELPRLASRASAHAMVSHLVGHVMAGHGISPYAAPLLLYTAASGGL